MKDYTLNKDSKKKFIKDIKFTGENNETMTVIFADGTQFPDVEVTDENIEKIRQYQEVQARRGVQHLSTFKLKSAVSIIGSLGISGVTYAMADYFGQLGTNFGYGMGGVVGIAGSAVALTLLYYYFKYDGISDELEKVQYRDEHRATLNSYLQYPNSLSGVRHRKYFEACARDGLDPYSVISMDGYDKRDLEKIVENITREKQYQFQYRGSHTK